MQLQYRFDVLQMIRNEHVYLKTRVSKNIMELIGFYTFHHDSFLN